VWSSQKRGLWLSAALVALIAAIGVYLAEKSIVTEAERVEGEVQGLVSAFERKDHDALAAFFSVRAPDLRAQAEQALTWVDIPNGLDIKDMRVRTSNEDTRAISHFRANGTVSFRGMATTHVASRWEFTWQKEQGRWKVIDVQRLNPYKEEKMELFDPRPN
jgi:ketosteroid isomerase-like protein